MGKWATSISIGIRITGSLSSSIKPFNNKPAASA
jgi:hypothetical protein